MLYRKITTRSLPADAAIMTRRDGVKEAVWKSRDGKKQTSPVQELQDGSLRIKTESRTWYARYRAVDGTLLDRSTGCRDKNAAQAVLNDWLRTEEQIRAGVLSREELRTARHGEELFEKHLDAYCAHLRRSGCSDQHVYTTRKYLERLAGETGIRRLDDLTRTRIEKHLHGLLDAGLSIRSRNAVLARIRAICMWLKRRGELSRNPCEHISMLNEKTDPRRPRRALTLDEAGRLIEATLSRRIESAFKNRGGKRANLHADTVARLEWKGRMWAMAYRVMLGTALRYGELRSLRGSALKLDDSLPHLVLRACDAKNRRDALIPVPGVLVEDLRAYAEEARSRSRDGRVVRLIDADPLLFPLPSAGVKEFDRDLRYAGIDKVTPEGSLDLHALRHTCLTWLGAAGEAPQTIMLYARHADLSTTTRYMHATLVDLHAAGSRLPDPTVVAQKQVRHALEGDSFVALLVAPADGKTGHSASSRDNAEGLNHCTASHVHVDRNANNDRGFQEMSSGGMGKRLARPAGFEPATSCSGGKRSIP